MPTYIDIIGKYYPNVKCHSMGDGSVYENITYVSGDPLPSKNDLDTLMLSDIKIEMWRKIQSERDRRKAGGVLVDGNWFHSDDTSRIQQLGLVMFGANMPNNIMWKTMSGSFVLMTPALAQQIFTAVAASDMVIFAKAEEHKANMNASPDPASYNYLTGWPLIYGE